MSDELLNIYKDRYKKILIPLVEPLKQYIEDCFLKEKRIDRITVRAKSLERFLAKAEKLNDNGKKKYADPINQIQDQLGARIVTFYMDDVDRVAKEVEKYFRPIEKQRIVPDSEKEFGYFGQHYILLIPPDIFTNDIPKTDAPDFFEFQIKTLYQHAWAEANHDLGYKPDRELSSDEKRRIAFTAAQSWGADMIYNELHKNSISK
jgi:putative GTP pyrophosphokinase